MCFFYSTGGELPSNFSSAVAVFRFPTTVGLQRFLKFATPTPVPTPEVGVVTPESTPFSLLNFKEITTISCNKEIFLGYVV